jgi:hypothetical protein
MVLYTYMTKIKEILNRSHKFIPTLMLVLLLLVSSQIIAPTPANACDSLATCLFGGFKGLIPVTLDVAGIIVSPLAGLLLKLTSLLTMITGAFLNFTVQYSIINMKAHMPGAEINSAWKVLRDVANMSFIFILLYTSIMLIISKKTVGDVRNLVVKMVIAALLINFSQFFTKIIIDASNLIALTLYNAVAPGALDNPADFMKYGISNSITDHLRLQSIFNLVGQLDGTKIITMGIMGSLLLLVAAFIFLAMGLMFIIRFALLIFVIIFSPVAFVADIIPNAKDYFNKWWTTLINQAFFPSIFFLLMWVALTILQGLKPEASTSELNGLGGYIDAQGKAKFDSGAIPLLVNYIVAIAFIIIAFISSKAMASKVPGGVGKIIGTATGWAGAGTMGIAGRFGRGTAGRGAQALANNKALQERALRGDMSARLALKAAQKTAKASFDPRATGLGKTLGAGGAQKGGFAADVKSKNDFNEGIVKSLATTATEKATNEKLVEDINGELKKAKENLEEAKKNAKEKAEDVAKSAELIAAESAALEAKAEAERANKGLETTEDAARRIADYEKARAEVRRLEKLREKEQQELIKKEIAGAERDLELTQKSLDYAKGIDQGKDRVEKAARYREEKLEVGRRFILSTDRVLLFGKVKSEIEGAPNKIRAAAKGKSRAERIAELAAEDVKEKEEKEKGGEKPKEEKDGGETEDKKTPSDGPAK